MTATQPTANAIARLAGISPHTSKTYLADPSAVRPSTAAKIKQAIERHEQAVTLAKKAGCSVHRAIDYLADPLTLAASDRRKLDAVRGITREYSRGGAQSVGHGHKRLHQKTSGADYRDEYLMGLSTQMNAACDRWLAARGIRPDHVMRKEAREARQKRTSAQHGA